MALQNPIPPRLPDPQGQYDRTYFNTLLNVLRLYFNRLSNAIATLLGPLGATYLQAVYGEYISTVTQTIASTTTAYPITFNTVIMQNGLSLTSGNVINVEQSGIYSLSLSVQFSNNDIAIQNAALWFRQNGVDISNSRARYSLTERHSGVPGHSRRDFHTLVECTAGDTLEAYWFATNTAVSLEYLPAATLPTRPAAASASLYVAFVSAVPSL